MKHSLVYIALIVCSVLWGGSFVFTKELFLSEPNMEVIILVTLRLAVASAVAIPAMLLLHKLEAIRKGDFWWFALLAFTQPFAYSLLETAGVKLTTGSLSSIIIATIPLFVPFTMTLIYRERLWWSSVLGVIISMIGIVLMIFGSGSLQLEAGMGRGIICLVLAVITAVAYILVLVKIVDHYRSVTITIYQNFFSLIYFLPVMFCTTGTQVLDLSWSPKMLLLIGILGIGCSTIAYVLYNIGIRYEGATRASIFNNGIPVFTLIIACLLGQEQLTWYKVVGMLIVVAGLVIAQKRHSSTNPSQQ